jgi:hypothetical protein
VSFPFAPLVQSYEQCHNSPSVVFFNQFGITMGNLTVLLPISALVIVGLFMWARWQWNLQGGRPSYSSVELDQSLRSLALAMLHQRDRTSKTSDPSLIELQSMFDQDPTLAKNPEIVPIIQHLVEEMSRLSSQRDRVVTPTSTTDNPMVAP